MRGLTQCTDDDIIMISDVGEFIEAEGISTHVYWLTHHMADITACCHKMFSFYLNRRTPEGWVMGSGFTTYQHLKRLSPKEVREQVHETNWHPRFQGGWHFSQMGGCKGDQKSPPKTLRRFNWELSTCRLVPIDEWFPTFVRNNVPYLQAIGLLESTL